MVLVDTNVWIEFFRFGNALLEDLLEDGEVLCHPVVIGELATGTLPERRRTLGDLRALPRTKIASEEETLLFLERNKLWGKGLQWNDLLLLASALLDDAPLWTLDKRLSSTAEIFDVRWLGR